ncbi:MAG: DUF503 domain-containing protein [Actinobacteria bacterium]|nr:DUF503 domain-containing protein [Actinomycetota bacterium]
MVVGLLQMELFIDGATSLKEKRQVVKSIIGKIEGKFNVSVSEVDHQELWQRAAIGIAHTSATESQTRKVLQNIRNFVEALGKATVTRGEISIFAPE